MHVTRKLRRNQTPWEQKFWSFLRARQLGGMKFRRQYKIGPYVADFVCLERKLVVELDGGHHNEIAAKRADDRRDAFFNSLGYDVIRVWNTDIERNLAGVAERILQSSQPHLTSPKWERNASL